MWKGWQLYISICNNCIILFYFGSHRLSVYLSIYNTHTHTNKFIYQWLDRWFRNQINVNRKFYFDGGISQMAINGVHRRAQQMKQNNKKEIQVTSINLSLIFVSLCVRVCSTYFCCSFRRNFQPSNVKEKPHNLMRSNWENKISICNYYLFTWWLFNRKRISTSTHRYISFVSQSQYYNNEAERKKNTKKRKMNDMHTLSTEPVRIYTLYMGMQSTLWGYAFRIMYIHDRLKEMPIKTVIRFCKITSWPSLLLCLLLTVQNSVCGSRINIEHIRRQLLMLDDMGERRWWWCRRQRRRRRRRKAKAQERNRK